MFKKNEIHLRLIDPGAIEHSDGVSDDGRMLLAAEGDTRAFAEIVSNNELAVRRFCFGMLGNRAQADEVAQDTFLKLWQERGRYRPCNKLRAFLFSIAKNRCISLLRRRAVVSFIGFDALPVEPVSLSEIEMNSGSGVDTAERDAILRAAVARLPAKLRTAVILRFMEEMGYDEIAAVIGRSASAARSRVHYGLKTLARNLPEEVCAWKD